MKFLKFLFNFLYEKVFDVKNFDTNFLKLFTHSLPYCERCKNV